MDYEASPKTDTPVNVPLLKIPLAILKKYDGQLPKGELLPVLSNQKLNSYLKRLLICVELIKILLSTLQDIHFRRLSRLLKVFLLKQSAKC